MSVTAKVSFHWALFSSHQIKRVSSTLPHCFTQSQAVLLLCWLQLIVAHYSLISGAMPLSLPPALAGVRLQSFVNVQWTHLPSEANWPYLHTLIRESVKSSFRITVSLDLLFLRRSIKRRWKVEIQFDFDISEWCRWSGFRMWRLSLLSLHQHPLSILPGVW